MGDDSLSLRGVVKGPTSSDSLALNYISVGPFTLTAGDLNAHSFLWDERQPADQQGKTFEDWLIFRIYAYEKSTLALTGKVVF